VCAVEDGRSTWLPEQSVGNELLNVATLQAKRHFSGESVTFC
jgi:hypothetical protein